MKANIVPTNVRPMMDRVEARQVVNRINEGIGDLRRLIVDLYDRKGWQALGYDSWRACVVAEFEQSQSYLYRLLAAGKIEKDVSPIGEKGPIRESHLRPLMALPTPEARRQAYDEATEGGQPTTAAKIKSIVTKALATMKPETPVEYLNGHTPEEKRMLIEQAEEVIDTRYAKQQIREQRQDTRDCLERWSTRLSDMRRQAERHDPPVPKFVRALEKAADVLAEETVRLLAD